jgi:hypothetical protein
MDQFLQINLGQILQVGALLLGVGMMFQSLKSDIKDHARRLSAVETALIVVTSDREILGRLDERMLSMDKRMLSQGQRIDSQATLINGRLEAINDIVRGHTAQLNNLPHGKTT